MADEENKVTAEDAAGAAGKSVKKKSVKKAAKKSVKKKSVKKVAKKAVKKKSVKSASTEKSVATNGNGQKEKAKIRLKDDAAKKEKAQKIAAATAVKAPAKRKKDSLSLLSTLSIALLFIVGIWALASYMSDNEGTVEVKTETAVEPAVVVTPAEPVAADVPAQMPVDTGAEKAVVETTTEPEADATPKAAETISDVEPVEKAGELDEESKGFFESIFGRKDESSTEGAKETEAEVAAGDAATSQPADPASSPQPYGQPAPWGPAEDFGPPPGFYDDMPPQGFGPPPGFDAPGEQSLQYRYSK